MRDQVIPTRMELLNIKNRISLAKKGHKLLKQKRDALILEFFKILKKARNIRAELNEKMKKAYESLAVAKAHHNIFELEVLSFNTAKQIEVDVEVRNIMGVKIPKVSAVLNQKEYPHKGYSLIGTTALIEDVVERYEEIVKMALELAEVEIAIKRLIKEIEKTKRRVNSLEFIMIPTLEEQKKTITLKLDELERDSFSSLKVIKRKLEKEEKK